MAGWGFSDNCSVTSLKACLPDLQIENVQMPEVSFNQVINLQDRSLQESQTKRLRDAGPTMDIQGLAEILHGDSLRLRLALKTLGHVADGTQAKICWEARLVAERGVQELGKRAKFFSVPPANIIRRTDDYIEIKLEDIIPNFIQHERLIKLAWKARLEFLCEIGNVDTVERKLVLCCHHISDSLETCKQKHQLRGQLELGMAQGGMPGVNLRP